jgi:hypothetical protein
LLFVKLKKKNWVNCTSNKIVDLTQRAHKQTKLRKRIVSSIGCAQIIPSNPINDCGSKYTEQIKKVSFTAQHTKQIIDSTRAQTTEL